MDGVLYRGDRALPGARALLAELERRRIPFALVTNNSSRTPRQYARHLAAMGMRVPESRIITSSLVAAAYLRRRIRPGARVLVIGEHGLRLAMRRAGFTVAWDRVAAVVVGLDRTLNYRKLTRATVALLDGALFVAANPDPLIPTSRGVIPGAGVPVEALAYAAGRRPVMLGKPQPGLLLEGMARTGTAPAETVMVGDQLATDVAAGHAAGTITVHVRTGVPVRRRLKEDTPDPDLVVSNLRELWRWAAGRVPAAQRRGAASALPFR
jgi:4-nitrophenyl phosphatase